MKKPLTYRSAGVDIDEGDRFIKLIRPLAKSTARKELMGSIGGFGALFSAGFPKLKEPVLVSGTDGVGTKLELAFKVGRHDTIGIDLVAMCVNDIVVSGAEPLFFLDYFAVGKLKAELGREVVKGIARGCREAGAALAGGETAEMPGFYKKGEYELAGFAVGVVEKKKIIDGSKVRSGDIIIGLASSGLHSNGFSLARKALLERAGLKLSSKPKGLKKKLGETLLTPTKIYVKPILALTKEFKLKSVAHITGGGMTDNIPRALPSGLKAVIEKGSWKVPPIFTLIKEAGGVSEPEMMRTFNAGIGMTVIVKKSDAPKVIGALKKMRVKAWRIGTIQERKKREPATEFI
ncbi:MAG: phosphoribosylformylglycinamidine cyclo-ligase [Thermodesulfobacteriota bacterium]